MNSHTTKSISTTRYEGVSASVWRTNQHAHGQSPALLITCTQRLLYKNARAMIHRHQYHSAIVCDAFLNTHTESFRWKNDSVPVVCCWCVFVFIRKSIKIKLIATKNSLSISLLFSKLPAKRIARSIYAHLVALICCFDKCDRLSHSEEKNLSFHSRITHISFVGFTQPSVGFIFISISFGGCFIFAT